MPIKIKIIKNHFLKLIFSFKKNELANKAKGIVNWDPINTGDKTFACNNAIFKKKLTPTPIVIEKNNKGKISFFFGILNLQKGIKHKKTKPIRKDENNIGGREVFNANFPIGYALPKKNIIINIKK